MLFDVIQSFYAETAGRPIRTAAVLAYQSFGDLLRFNPHFHALILEGGFDQAGRFVFVPLSDLARMTQYLGWAPPLPSGQVLSREEARSSNALAIRRLSPAEPWSPPSVASTPLCRRVRFRFVGAPL